MINESAKAICSLCGEQIPIGHKYWKRGKYGGRQHTNCAEYKTISTELMHEEAEKQSLANVRAIYF
jgi:hypothetical protein